MFGIRMQSTFLLLALSSGLWAGQDKVLATFDGGQITKKNAEVWMQVTAHSFDDTANLQMLQSLALTLAWYQEAQKRKLLNDPILKDEWQAAAGGIAQSRLRTDLSNSLSFTDAEIAEEIARGNYGGRPEKVRLRQLFKAYPAQANQEAKKEVLQAIVALKDRVEQGASFEKLAAEESDSQSKHRGGLIGNVAPGDLDPRVEKIIFALKPGGVSEPFATKEGVMLFYCDKRIEAINRPIEEQQERARRNLLGRAFDEQWAKYIDEQKAKITLHWPEKNGTASLMISGKQVPAEVLLTRLKRAFGSEVTWGGLDRAKAEKELRAFGLESILIAQFKAHASFKGSDWESQLELHRKQFWGRQVLYKDLNAQFKRPPEEELKAYFDKNRHKYTLKPEFEMQIIGWKLTQENIRQKTMLARQVRQKILKGEMKMDEAARKYSELGSKDKGGQIGWMPRNQVAAIGKHVLKVTDQLEVGQLGPLVRQGHHLFLIKVHNKKPGRPAKFEDVQGKVLDKVAEEKVKKLQKKMEEDWLTRIQFKKQV